MEVKFWCKDKDNTSLSSNCNPC